MDNSKRNKKIIISLSVIAAVLAVILCVVLIIIASDKLSAVTMRLTDYTGDISLTDKAGKDIPVSADKRLNDGNTLTTYDESKAHVLLDEDRMVTVMELSSAVFRAKGKKIELDLSEGSLFFNIEKPLEDNEAFDICTSTMVIGIRGTSGFVCTDENGNEVLYMTSGKVSVTATDPDTKDSKTEKVKAGEKLTVIVTENGIEMLIEKFSEYELPFDALIEITDDDNLMDAVTDDTGWDEEILRNRLSDVEAMGGDDESVSDPGENTSGVLVIPETVVDGIIHHAYYEYDYSDEFCGFMDRLINACRGGNMDTIGEICGYDNANQDEIDYVQTYLEANGLYSGSATYGTYRFLYEDYRCVIKSYSYSDAYKYVDAWIIPDEGEGYGTYVACGGLNWNGFSFLTGECSGGMFNGAFHRHEVDVHHTGSLDGEDRVRVTDYEGSCDNGLMVGISTMSTDDEEDITYNSYDNGAKTAQWYQKPGSGEKKNYRELSLNQCFMVGCFQCATTQYDHGTDMYPF